MHRSSRSRPARICARPRSRSDAMSGTGATDRRFAGNQFGIGVTGDYAENAVTIRTTKSVYSCIVDATGPASTILPCRACSRRNARCSGSVLPAALHPTRIGPETENSSCGRGADAVRKAGAARCERQTTVSLTESASSTVPFTIAPTDSSTSTASFSNGLPARSPPWCCSCHRYKTLPMCPERTSEKWSG